MDVELFFLASRCSCIICCRCSPMQKAAVVKMIQKYSDGATLAVGDGANDVAMIQAADVGVGISGEEGMQASLAADYSIAQFRFLRRLLFVHGAFSYHRLTKMILYFFYKTIAESVVLFCYSCWALSSDTALFDSWSIVFFNIFFTSWPPLAMGIWDRIFPISIMEHFPGIYTLSQKELTFSLKLFFSWVLNGIVHALVIFYIGYHTFKSDVFWSHGRVGNLRCFGTAVNIALVFTVNLKAAIEMDSHTVMSLVAFGGSLVMLSTFMFSYCLTSPASPVVRVDAEMADIILDILYSPQIILFIIIATFVAISIDILFNAIQRLLYNSLHDETLSKQLIMGKKIDALSESFTKVRQFMMRTSESALNLVNHPFKTRGYAFSQDEGAIVPQSDIVRIYDSRMPKQAGSSIRSERSFRYSDRLSTVDTSSLQMEKHFSNDDDVSEWNNLSKTGEESDSKEEPFREP